MNLTQLSKNQQIDIYALAHERTGISQVVLEIQLNERINQIIW
jgi:hypothetical protein